MTHIASDGADPYDQYYTHAEVGRSGGRVLVHLWRRSRICRELRRLDIPPNFATVLDVGCGRGDDLYSLRDFARVVGIEPDGQAMAVARGRGLTVYDRWEAMPAGERFDLVLARHVLEHATDPADLLRHMASRLNDGGSLLAFTPNVLSLGRRVFTSRWRGYDVPLPSGHLFRDRLAPYGRCRGTRAGSHRDVCDSLGRGRRVVLAGHVAEVAAPGGGQIYVCASGRGRVRSSLSCGQPREAHRRGASTRLHGSTRRGPSSAAGIGRRVPSASWRPSRCGCDSRRGTTVRLRPSGSGRAPTTRRAVGARRVSSLGTDREPSVRVGDELSNLTGSVGDHGEPGRHVVEQLVRTHRASEQVDIGETVDTDVRCGEDVSDLGLRNRIHERHIRQSVARNPSDQRLLPRAISDEDDSQLGARLLELRCRVEQVDRVRSPGRAHRRTPPQRRRSRSAREARREGCVGTKSSTSAPFGMKTTASSCTPWRVTCSRAPLARITTRSARR